MKRPQTAPTFAEALAAVPGERAPVLLAHLAGPAVRGRYFHWDELRRRTPPDDLTLEEWWMTLKVARAAMGRRFLPFVSNLPFSYVITDEALALLNRIDRFASGRIGAPEAITDSTTRDRYLVSSLMEEAISSSLLEGAATTRPEAKALLRSGRAPRTRGELMVVNNYRTMQFIRDDLDRDLTLNMVLDIHQMITEGTLDNPDDAGRIQQPGEDRVVGAPDDASVIFHTPPPAEQLPDLLEQMVAFANGSDEEPFVHPVVRAVALHFSLSYLHPFVDGNGRTARALFYRSMLGQGYWLAEFLSISRLLYRAPAQYGRAFLYTETDEADFTYFLMHQLEVVSRSIDELLEHLERKVGEVRMVERALRSTPGLNHRQLALMSHALRHPDAVYTFESHRNSHNVTYQTARADLLDLEALHLLERGKVGRQYRFYPAADLADRVLDQ
jgi:Fic family protein